MGPSKTIMWSTCGSYLTRSYPPGAPEAAGLKENCPGASAPTGAVAGRALFPSTPAPALASASASREAAIRGISIAWHPGGADRHSQWVASCSALGRSRGSCTRLTPCSSPQPGTWCLPVKLSSKWAFTYTPMQPPYTCSSVEHMIRHMQG